MADHMATTVVIKAKCGTDCRRFEIEQAMTLAELRNQLYVIYELQEDDSDLLKYVDEEGDLVTLTEEDDFRRVVMDMRKDNKALRLVLLSRYRKTVTFKEPLKSHVSSPLAPRSSGGLTSLAEDEALNSMGEPWDTADVQLLQHCRDEEILAMLRDISLYIQSREGGGSPSFIRSAVKNRKRLITPGAMEKSLLINRDSVVDADEDDEAGSGIVADIEQRFASPTKSPATWSGRRDQPRLWELQDVSDWLVYAGYSDLAPLFQDNEIDGEVLEALDHEALISMGIKVAGKRIKLLKDFRLLIKSGPEGLQSEV